MDFNTKYAGVPVWGWTVGGAGTLALAYFGYRRYEASKATSKTATSSTGTTTSPSNSTLQSEIGGLYASQPTSSSYTGSSTGTVTVDNVVGLPQAQAIQVLQDENLSPVGTPGGDTLTVLTQTPRAGSNVLAYTPVILTSGTPPTTGKTSAPGVPSGLSITPTANGFDSAWGSSSGATSYELKIVGAGGKGTGTSNVDKAGITGTHYNSTQKLSKGAYKGTVRATNSAGTSAWSPDRPFSVK